MSKQWLSVIFKILLDLSLRAEVSKPEVGGEREMRLMELKREELEYQKKREELRKIELEKERDR